ncbi:MAG: phosphoadenylyl-sulfate reductase [Armatimonadetes bacterium]|nr:phosphoadenylyl-sulfate reductase [Armatimonadota bacterium]
MAIAVEQVDIKGLVDDLDFSEKVERSLALIEQAYEEFGDGLVVANSLGKDSCVVWDLVKRVSPHIRGFVITTRFKPVETVEFMNSRVRRYPELRVYQSDVVLPEDLHKTAPDACCEALKVEPTRRAIQEMNVTCWTTGLRCTEGRTRVDFQEWEERDAGLVKLNPILLWHEREVWQYLALHEVPVNPLYAQGYRSLGCAPCSQVSTGPNERAGRWLGTSKCGGECGIHTRALLAPTP